MHRNTVLKDTAAPLRAAANLDFGDRVLVLLDRAPALMWPVAALLAAISAPLLLTIVTANPAIGVLAGLLAWAAHNRRPRQLASEDRDADVLAGFGVLLFVGARLLAEVYLLLGIALGTCAVWLIRAALTERYMARGPARPQTPVKTAVGAGGEGTFSGRSPSARNCRTADTGTASAPPTPPPPE